MAFKPGQSGNQSGRPKVDFEVRQLAREYGQEAIERLVAIMRGDNPALAKAASEALLDGGYGKPVQSVGGRRGQRSSRELFCHAQGRRGR